MSFSCVHCNQIWREVLLSGAKTYSLGSYFKFQLSIFMVILSKRFGNFIINFGTECKIKWDKIKQIKRDTCMYLSSNSYSDGWRSCYYVVVYSSVHQAHKKLYAKIIKKTKLFFVRVNGYDSYETVQLTLTLIKQSWLKAINSRTNERHNTELSSNSNKEPNEIYC